MDDEWMMYDQWWMMDGCASTTNTPSSTISGCAMLRLSCNEALILSMVASSKTYGSRRGVWRHQGVRRGVLCRSVRFQNPTLPECIISGCADVARGLQVRMIPLERINQNCQLVPCQRSGASRTNTYEAVLCDTLWHRFARKSPSLNARVQRVWSRQVMQCLYGHHLTVISVSGCLKNPPTSSANDTNLKQSKTVGDSPKLGLQPNAHKPLKQHTSDSHSCQKSQGSAPTKDWPPRVNAPTSSTEVAEKSLSIPSSAMYHTSKFRCEIADTVEQELQGSEFAHVLCAQFCWFFWEVITSFGLYMLANSRVFDSGPTVLSRENHLLLHSPASPPWRV